SSRHSLDHLRTVLDDSSGFILSADHEARDVLEKNKRDASLGAKLHEMSSLKRGFRQQDSVVCDDANLVAYPVGEPADQCGAVPGLELLETAPVYQTGDDLAHFDHLAWVAWDEAIEVLGRIERLFSLGSAELARLPAQS